MKYKKFFAIVLLLQFFTITCFANNSELDEGISYFINGKYNIAEFIFNKLWIKDINNQDYSSLLFLANTYYVNGKYKLAKESYNSLIKHNYLDLDLINFVKFMYAECCVLLGDYSEAIKLCDGLTKKNSSVKEFLLPYIYYNKIFSQYKLGEYNKALNTITVFKSHTKNFNVPNKINEHIDYILADAWFAKGNYKNSEINFKKFIDTYKNSELLLYANLRLLQIYDEQKKYEEGLNVIKSIDPKKYLSKDIEIIVKYNTGRILTQQGKFNQAIKLYQQLIENLNNHEILPYLYLDVAYCYFQIKDYNKAIAFLNKISKNSPKDIYINSTYLLGLSYYNAKKYDDSIRTLHSFVKNYSVNNNKWYYDSIYLLGLSYFNKGEYEKSIKFLSLLKDKSSAYYILSQIYIANCYKKIKEYELAKITLNKLLDYAKINDDKIKAYILYELADAYKLSCDYETAVKYYDKVISIGDSKVNKLAKISLAEVYIYLGKYDESETILKSVLNSLSSKDSEIYIKAVLIYLTAKYNKREFDSVKEIAKELLQKQQLEKEQKKFVLNILVNVSKKEKDLNNTILYLNELCSISDDTNEKFNFELEILRTIFAKKSYEELNSKLTYLIKKYNKPEQQCILNYFQLKYYLSINTNQKDIVKSSFSKMQQFLPEDYSLFNKEEFSGLVNICLNNNIETTMYLAENIIPYLKFLSDYEKFEIEKNIIENFISNKIFNNVLKLASIIKNISYDTNISAYSEFVVGRVYELTGKLKLAENIYKSIIEKYNNSEYLPKVYVALIDYYNKINNIELAKFYENILLSKYEDKEETHRYLYNKSLKLIEQEQYQEAINNLSLITNSKDIEIASLSQKLLADCYYKMKKYREAMVEYLRVIYLYPDNTNLCAESQFMVGVCAENMNLIDEAKKAYYNSKVRYPGTLWAQEAELKLKKIK